MIRSLGVFFYFFPYTKLLLRFFIHEFVVIFVHFGYKTWILRLSGEEQAPAEGEEAPAEGGDPPAAE